MLALVLDDAPKVVEVPLPRPAPGEALIKVLAAGVCNTDLELVRGYMGFRGTLGHEFVGEVVECSNDFLLGKRVVGEINCVCHDCTFCRMELPHHCANRTVLGILGLMAPLLAINFGLGAVQGMNTLPTVHHKERGTASARFGRRTVRKQHTPQ